MRCYIEALLRDHWIRIDASIHDMVHIITHNPRLVQRLYRRNTVMPQA